MASKIYLITDKAKISRDAVTSSRKYHAFKKADYELYRVKIRPKARAWERMQYCNLWRIVENGYGIEVGLVFSFGCVLIKGHNLAPIAEALDRHCCDIINEFDSAVWDAPTDPKATFVDSIEIYTETREQIVRATDKMLAEMIKPNLT